MRRHPPAATSAQTPTAGRRRAKQNDAARNEPPPIDAEVDLRPGRSLILAGCGLVVAAAGYAAVATIRAVDLFDRTGVAPSLSDAWRTASISHVIAITIGALIALSLASGIPGRRTGVMRAALLPLALAPEFVFNVTELAAGRFVWPGPWFVHLAAYIAGWLLLMSAALYRRAVLTPVNAYEDSH